MEIRDEEDAEYVMNDVRNRLAEVVSDMCKIGLEWRFDDTDILDGIIEELEGCIEDLRQARDFLEKEKR